MTWPTLSELRLRGGTHKLTATVTDPTRYVRDPAIRGSTALTRTRTWTVDTGVHTREAAPAPGFTAATPENTRVAAGDVIYAETTHPSASIPAVRWTVDGRSVRPRGNDRDLDLSRYRLRPGTHRVTARVVDPASGRASAPRMWTVDARRPRAAATFSTPAAVRHGRYVFDDAFTMKLNPTDDGFGTALAEFQVDGDGWYRYFGWPTDSAAPFRFTPLGTNVDDLIYGKLGNPARAVEWEHVRPGYGDHTIEYRAIGAAGNVGPTTRVRVALRKAE